MMPEAPPERLAVVRALVGAYATVYLTVRAPSFLRVAAFAPERFDPVGVAAWLPAPLPPAWAGALFVALLALAPLFALGWRQRLVAPAFALLLLWVTTYRNCFGHMAHTDNLLVLQAAILAFAPAADALSLDRRAGRARERAPSSYGGALWLMMAVTVVTYALAGWAKLASGEPSWLGGDVLRNQVAADTLRKLRLGGTSSPLAGLLLRHDAVFPPLAVATVAIELGAPLALLPGRIRSAWVAAVWSMHLGIALVMAIVFAYPLSGVAFACFFPVERLAGAGCATAAGSAR